jgi:hypothetical protein
MPLDTKSWTTLKSPTTRRIAGPMIKKQVTNMCIDGYANVYSGRGACTRLLYVVPKYLCRIALPLLRDSGITQRREN